MWFSSFSWKAAVKYLQREKQIKKSKILPKLFKDFEFCLVPTSYGLLRMTISLISDSSSRFEVNLTASATYCGEPVLAGDWVISRGVFQPPQDPMNSFTINLNNQSLWLQLQSILLKNKIILGMIEDKKLLADSRFHICSHQCWWGIHQKFTA